MQLLADANEINQIIDKDKDIWGVLFEGKTKGEVVRYRRIARDIDFPNKNWAAVQRNKEYFFAIVGLPLVTSGDGTKNLHSETSAVWGRFSLHWHHSC